MSSWKLLELFLTPKFYSNFKFCIVLEYPATRFQGLRSNIWTPPGVPSRQTLFRFDVATNTLVQHFPASIELFFFNHLSALTLDIDLLLSYSSLPK